MLNQILEFCFSTRYQNCDNEPSKMRSIAVAGGTGPVGKTIVDGLVAYGKHKIFVLCRNVRNLIGIFFMV